MMRQRMSIESSNREITKRFMSFYKLTALSNEQAYKIGDRITKLMKNKDQWKYRTCSTGAGTWYCMDIIVHTAIFNKNWEMAWVRGVQLFGKEKIAIAKSINRQVNKLDKSIQENRKWQQLIQQAT